MSSDAAFQSMTCGDGTILWPQSQLEAAASTAVLLCDGVGGHHGNLLGLARALLSSNRLTPYLLDLPGQGVSTTPLKSLKQTDRTLDAAIAYVPGHVRDIILVTVSAGVWFVCRDSTVPTDWRSRLRRVVIINPLSLSGLHTDIAGDTDQLVNVRATVLRQYLSDAEIAKADADPLGNPWLSVAVARGLIRRSETVSLDRWPVTALYAADDPLRSIWHVVPDACRQYHYPSRRHGVGAEPEASIAAKFVIRELP